MSKIFNTEFNDNELRNIIKEELDKQTAVIKLELDKQTNAISSMLNSVITILTTSTVEVPKEPVVEPPVVPPVVPPITPPTVKESYYVSDGIHFIKIPVSKFCIRYHDKSKRAGTGNYFNLGFFANFSESVNGSSIAFTLPVANLVCDINQADVHSVAWKYLVESGRGVVNGKLIFPANTSGTDFKGKNVSTLVIDVNNKVSIAKLQTYGNLLSINGASIKYAVSGVPIIVDGKDGKWTAECVPEGWGSGAVAAAWHTALGVKKSEPDFIYCIAFRTTTGNMLNTGGKSESWSLLGKYGFETVLKMDGGGSFYFKYGSVILEDPTRPGDRRISNIVQL